MPRPVFDELSDFLAPARAEYRAEIRALAAEAISECNGDREAIDEWLYESIDGHEWVIVTFKARFVPLVAECEPSDAEDEYGFALDTPERIAWGVMSIDARAAVSRLLAERGAA